MLAAMVGTATTVSLDDGSGTAGSRAGGALRVIYPRELRGRHPLGAEPVALGRVPPAPIAIAHATVSRRHAEVTAGAAGDHVIRDLGSRHGTLVDGAAIGAAPHRLADGSVVRIGDVLMVYEREPDDAAATADAADHVALPGDAPVMRRLRRQVAAAAPDPAPVLISGDTGTGKEWVARELHRLGGRRGAFVAVNCAAVSPQLVESQLFGHVRGAFSGAVADHDGWFRQAADGTLFLDEVGELALDLQAKLLRVVQDGVIQPIGARQATTVDVRLIAATNRDLAAEIDAGRFRRDLHARLARLELRVPSLAARRGDVLDWIDRLWATWCRDRDRPAAPLEWRPAAATAILDHAWLDNLRGLDRLVHAVAAGDRARPLDVRDLPAWLAPPAATPTPAPTPTAPASRGVPTKAEFLAAWEAHGSVRALARHFGRDRRQIQRWLVAHGVRVPDDDAP
jgi:two-component system NtrC family response regulator